MLFFMFEWYKSLTFLRQERNVRRVVQSMRMILACIVRTYGIVRACDPWQPGMPRERVLQPGRTGLVVNLGWCQWRTRPPGNMRVHLHTRWDAWTAEESWQIKRWLCCYWVSDRSQLPSHHLPSKTNQHMHLKILLSSLGSKMSNNSNIHPNIPQFLFTLQVCSTRF
jgi:hypothetical protein